MADENMGTRMMTTPSPDPTTLTTDQLKREIEQLRAALKSEIDSTKEVFESKLMGLRTFYDSAVIGLHTEIDTKEQVIDTKIHGQSNIFDTRLSGMDRAVMLLQALTDKIPTTMDDKVGHLKALHQEKFDSIATQFIERDVRTEQTAAGVKIAVDAALQAAKEAVGEQNRSFALATAKSEAATTKQIDAQALSIQTAYKGLDDKIIDMKDRLTRIEAIGLGTDRAVNLSQTDRRDTNYANIGSQGNNIAIMALVVAFVGVIAAIAGWLYTSRSDQPHYIYQQPPPAVQRQSYQPNPDMLPQYTFRNVDLNK
jgi:hypothetical protein